MILHLIFASFLCNAQAQVLRPNLAEDLTAIGASAIPANTQDIHIPEAMAQEIVREKDRRPIIITVPGIRFEELGWGPLEPKIFMKLLKLLLPHKKINELALVAAFRDYNAQYDILKGPAEELYSGDEVRMEDNYLEAQIMALPGYNADLFTIIPFRWSRDPADTETVVPTFIQNLAWVHDYYKGTGRPIYILVHSWGGILMHETLHRLGKRRPDIVIDKLITNGSPLVPSNAVTNLFLKLEIAKEDLERAVTKPAILRQWVNVWCSRDPFANFIPAADKNIQVDAHVERVEPQLGEIIQHEPSLRIQALKDLFKMCNIGAWHAVYMLDINAVLRTLNKTVYVPVFRPLVVPQLMMPIRPSAAKAR